MKVIYNIAFLHRNNFTSDKLKKSGLPVHRNIDAKPSELRVNRNCSLNISLDYVNIFLIYKHRNISEIHY